MLKRHRVIRIISTLLWVGVNLGILVLSLLPADKVMGGHSINDKLAHWIGYAVLGALTYLFLSFLHNALVERTGMKILLTIAYCTLLGGTIELVQPLTGRSMELLDLLSDLIGALMGSVIMRRLVDAYHVWSRNRDGDTAD